MPDEVSVLRTATARRPAATWAAPALASKLPAKRLSCVPAASMLILSWPAELATVCRPSGKAGPLLPPASKAWLPFAWIVAPSRQSIVGALRLTRPPSSTRPRCKPSLLWLITARPDTSMRAAEPIRNTSSGPVPPATDNCSRVMLPPAVRRAPSSCKLRPARNTN